MEQSTEMEQHNLVRNYHEKFKLEFSRDNI